MIKVLQCNLNHCATSYQLMWQEAASLKCDVVVVSDPYQRPTGNRNIVQNDEGSAAIVVTGAYPIQRVVSKNQRGFVAAIVNGVLVLSCYIPPSIPASEFRDIIDAMTPLIISHPKVLVAGDFNAWSEQWGSDMSKRGHVQKEKGRALLDAMLSQDLVVLNTGTTPTFQVPGRQSVIDIAFASAALTYRVQWTVMSASTLSDHRPITYTIGEARARTAAEPRSVFSQWKLAEFDSEAYKVALARELRRINSRSPEDLITAMSNACDSTMQRYSQSYRSRPQAFWWNEEIADLRRTCLQANRQRQRAYNTPRYDELHEIYKVTRNTLKQCIKRTKRSLFNELLEQADDTPFGQLYNILMNMINGNRTPRERNPEVLARVVDELFPTHQDVRWSEYSHGSDERPEPVTNIELIEIAERLKAKKAPGPDGIPNGALACAIRSQTDVLREIYQQCLEEGRFPDPWKRQKLVLIPKPGKPPGESGSVRPICLLDTLGKGLERIILKRLNNYIEEHGSLSDRQYGFRQGRSTVDAIQNVVETAAASRARHRYSNRLCAIVTLDVKNAFNSASWTAIGRALRTIRIPHYLYKIIGSYFENRVLLYETRDGVRQRPINAGVPQGSVLGPCLWNLMYDEILRLPMPEGVSLTGFADDVVMTVVCTTLHQCKRNIEDAVRRIELWMASVGLELASHKTEYIIVSSHRTALELDININGHQIRNKRSLKYLGVVIDDRLAYTSHIEYCVEKSQRLIQHLVRMMPNRCGPASSRRRLIASVVSARIRYGAPIFAHLMDVEARRQELRRVYTLLSRRVCSCFKTASHASTTVIAGMLPLHLLIMEDARCFTRRRTTGCSSLIARCLERQTSMELWQEEWAASNTGAWTRRLIPDIERWLTRRHGEVDFYLAQILTNHGFFGAYLSTMGFVDNSNCPECSGVYETAYHVLFECPQYHHQRRRISQAAGEELSPDTLISSMCSSRHIWQVVHEAARRITTRLQQRRILQERSSSSTQR